MILRSLNFWLFLMVIVCGISFWLAAGSPLPSGWNLALPGDFDTNSLNASGGETPIFEQPVHLRILNGTGENGLARQFSLLVAPRGCVVEGVGNANGSAAGSWPESMLICRRLDLEKAEILAKEFGSIPIIRQWDERMTEDAVLVLGQDHAKIKAALSQ
ncbi:MAG: LytR C-terminal domain-containing protein [bacterium]|nr:LytR C-terminal domain-containing protein [bacterium]